MSDISPSAITTDAEFEKQIAGADFETIKVLMAERAVQQGLVKRDIYDPSVLIVTEPGTAPRGYAKTVIINGQKHILEGSTEAELLQAETALYRAAVAQPAVTIQQTEQPARDASTGRFTSAEQVATDEQKATLQLQFQLGQISAADYIEQSGAISDYLAKQGVPLEELKAQVAEKQSGRVEQSWRDATEEFLHSSAGADWPGGDNMTILGRLLEENNLTDKPSVETLAAVWNYMKENGRVVENPEVTARQKLDEASQRISSATNVEEIREALRPNASGIFLR